MDQRSIALAPLPLAEDQLGFFRWGQVAGKVLITTDAGDWTFLSESDFRDFLAGRIGDGHPLFTDLQSKGFVRDGLDLDALAERMARRNRLVGRGPHLHILNVTQRCAQACEYCKAVTQRATGTSGDMTAETAEKVVQLALESTAPSITFEFEAQGGEPLLNFDVLRHVVEFARTSGEKAGKSLSFSLLSNFSAMTEERAEWLISNEVLLSTSLDGPAAVHDANRTWKHGSTHADVIRWIEYFNRRYAELTRDARLWRVDALLTVTDQTLAAWQQVVDEYVTRGLRIVHLRPLNPFGLARNVWSTIGYGMNAYLEGYRRVLDYILDLNRRGIDIMEGTAALLLTKILTADDPGVVDFQSPCGAGTAEIVYNFDGGVFPCSEARILDAMGDPLFTLGQVGELTVSDVLRHPTVRAIAAASLLDSQPVWVDSWNKPFCGISPVYNYMAEGDLFGQPPRSFEYKEYLAISTRLFELLANDSDAETVEILKRWTTMPRLANGARLLKEAP